MKYSDVEKLLDLNLITKEQHDAIISTLGLKSESSNYIKIFLILLSSISILLGVISLVSANWENIPAYFKQVSGILLLLGFWILGIKNIQKNDFKSQLISELGTFLGAGMFLANIALYGQIYQISSDGVNTTALFLAGIVVLPWLFRMRLVFILSVFVSFVLLNLFIEERTSLNGVGDMSINIIWVGILIALAAFLKTLKCADNFSFYTKILWRFGLPIFLFLISIETFEIDLNVYDLNLKEIWILSLVILMSFLLCIVQIRGIYKERNMINFVNIFHIITFSFFPMCIFSSFLRNDFYELIIFVGASLITGLFFMLASISFQSKFHAKIGVLLIFAGIITLFIKILKNYSYSGFVLIILGILLYTIVYILRVIHNKLIVKFSK